MSDGATVYADGIEQYPILYEPNTWTNTQTFTGIKSIGAYYAHIHATSGTAGSYTVLSTDEVIVATSGTGLILNLPAATGSGRKILIIQADAGSGITVTPNGADTIEGAATKAIAAQYGKCGLVDGTSGVWYDLGTGGV